MRSRFFFQFFATQPLSVPIVSYSQVEPAVTVTKCFIIRCIWVSRFRGFCTHPTSFKPPILYHGMDLDRFINSNESYCSVSPLTTKLKASYSAIQHRLSMARKKKITKQNARLRSLSDEQGSWYWPDVRRRECEMSHICHFVEFHFSENCSVTLNSTFVTSKRIQVTQKSDRVLD